MWASLAWTFVAVSFVEGLSVFHSLTKFAVAGGWGLVNFAALGLLISSPRKIQRPSADGFDKISSWDIAGIILTVGIIFIVAINAFWAAPNNWDSMTYHLPRVMHWIQNQSVEHYPTAILRQLYQPPGAEYLILHFQILSRSDQFANLIQWFSFLGSAIVVSLIALELGAGKSGQILAGLLTVTIPMAILQGTSTQNDLAVGFWLLCFAYFSLRLLKTYEQIRRRWFELFGASLSLAFALLTKGSAYVYAAPWILCFILVGAYKKRPIIFRDICIIVLICLAVNARFYSRNIQLFGAPLSAGSEDYVNKGNMVTNCLSNVVRNSALHLATPLPAVNHFMKQRIIALFGNAQNNSWSDFDILAASTNEDISGNPFHFLLALFIFAAVLMSRNSRLLLRIYVLLIMAGFGIFCALFKWQLFNSRLHLPLFLMSMPVIALILEKMYWRWCVGLIISILILAAGPSLFCNERHPLIGKENVFNMSRVQQYFFYRKFMALPYVVAVKSACLRYDLNVGLLLGNDDWEYPLWILLKRENPQLRIYHLGVNNVSSTLGGDANIPEVISEISDPPAFLKLDGKTFLKRRQFSFMSVYENAQLILEKSKIPE